MPVALFTCRTTPYRALGLDCFDIDRDARTYDGASPVIAHPPCRGWARLRGFAKPLPDELDLARFAVRMVRVRGGVLEHPAFSMLWADQSLPEPGQGHDTSGGWTLPVDQSWFGHRAPKATWLYIAGCAPKDIPPIPFHLGQAEGRIENMGRAERERTPVVFAAWLVLLASRCVR
jgi:hypothetical protein